MVEVLDLSAQNILVPGFAEILQIACIAALQPFVDLLVVDLSQRLLFERLLYLYSFQLLGAAVFGRPIQRHVTFHVVKG